MNLTFAAQLRKMITAGLGGDVEAPEIGVAVGRTTEYKDLDPAPLQTFETNAELPVSNLKVWMEPIQNLHGQDAPYPPGGGKNLQPYFAGRTVAGVTFTVDEMGVITANGTATADAFISSAIDTNTIYGDCLFNAAYGGSPTTYNAYVWDTSTGARAKKWDGVTPSLNGYEAFEEVQIVQGHVLSMNVRISAGYTANNVKFYPMLCRSTETDTTYAPYSNVCPISGRSEVNIWREATYDTSAEPAFTIQLGQTVYGGTVDVIKGEALIEWANIASYDGEILPGEWISDRDVYSPDATPTMGAQVCYKLATPQTITLTPQQLNTIIGTNNVWSDGGDVSLTYGTVRYTEGY